MMSMSKRQVGYGGNSGAFMWVESANRENSLFCLSSGVTVRPSHPQYLGVILLLIPQAPVPRKFVTYGLTTYLSPFEFSNR